jgi:hypothetical protein
MKKSVIILLVATLFTSVSFARGHHGGHVHHGGHYAGTGSNSNSHHVNGYVRRDGTYVAPHYQTNPNQTQRDNYNAYGNYNPHNGQYGRQYVDH